MRRNKDCHIECMSANHRDCFWTDANTCKLNMSSPSGKKPLVCGEMHTKKWGGPGYDNENHWCAKL